MSFVGDRVAETEKRVHQTTAWSTPPSDPPRPWNDATLRLKNQHGLVHSIPTEGNSRSFSRLREMSELLEGILAVVLIEKDDLSRRLADEPGNDGVMSRTTGS